MKLSVYVEGRIPAIVVPEGREVKLRAKDGNIEVVVEGDVIVSRPVGAGVIAHIGVVSDEDASDARVQHALDVADGKVVEVAAEAPSGLASPPDRRVDPVARAEDDRASEFIRLTTEEGLSDEAAQAKVWPEEFGNPQPSGGAEGPET